MSLVGGESRSRRRQKRGEVVSSSRSWKLPYASGHGPVSLGACLIGVAVLLGAAHQALHARPQVDVPTSFAGDFLPEPEETSLTLGELLREMSRKLNERQVKTRLVETTNTLRVMSDVAHFAISKADLEKEREADADAVAEVLAWAVSCHLDFSDVMRGLSLDENARLAGCLQELEPQFACLPGKGRVTVAGIRFEGHTDTRPFVRPGEFSDNQELSDARASRFAQRVLGCAQEKLSQMGKSVQIPYEEQGYSYSRLAEPDGRDGRNRRVEIRIDEQTGNSTLR